MFGEGIYILVGILKVLLVNRFLLFVGSWFIFWNLVVLYGFVCVWIKGRVMEGYVLVGFLIDYIVGFVVFDFGKVGVCGYYV